MLLTVTPNACIERTVLIPGFLSGNSYRIEADDLQVNVGGKGVNAARIASRFGVTVKALLWANSGQNEWLDRQLDREGVPHELISTDAETRTCINVVDGEGRKTEIVEAGNPLSVADGTRLLERYSQLLGGVSLVAICGSYPPAAKNIDLLGGAATQRSPLDMHLTLLCRLAKAAGIRVILDSKGLPFEMAVHNAKPWCIKPNLEEASRLVHREIATLRDERQALSDILRFGAQRILLSCGARGCYFATPEKVLFFHAPKVKEISPVGSGDSLVGAFAAKLMQGLDEVQALRWGVAAGSANAAQLRAGFCSPEDVEALLSEVIIEDVGH